MEKFCQQNYNCGIGYCWLKTLSTVSMEVILLFGNFRKVNVLKQVCNLTSKYTDDNIDGMEEHTMTLSNEISPGGDSSKNTHYAGPDHTVPTSINCLPTRLCSNQKPIIPIQYANR